VFYYAVMCSELFDLNGRTALITGGGRGIGFAIAKGLAEQGADVVLVARTQEQLDKACEEIRADTGRKARSFAYDLANVDCVEGLFEDVVKEVGGVDILVNCAGTTVRGPSEDVELKDWQRVQDVNLKSAFVLSQAFCRHRKEIGAGGRIINIGSLACHGARPTIAAYAASKGGMLMLTSTQSGPAILPLSLPRRCWPITTSISGCSRKLRSPDGGSPKTLSARQCCLHRPPGRLSPDKSSTSTADGWRCCEKCGGRLHVCIT